MAPSPRPLVAGNWKMNGLKASIAELGKVRQGAGKVGQRADLMLCPPATLLASFAEAARGSPVLIGAQDCRAEPAGAFTGDLSAEMLADAGATAVLVGHSERRTLHKESDADVRGKALAAWRAGLAAIVCIGETRAEREAGKALAVVGNQLAGSLPDAAGSLPNIAGQAGLVVAYEPVWAIGTGLTPTPADIVEVHAFIRKHLAGRFAGQGEAIRILYGGSVKPSNAREILTLANVNGALVGGASLKAADFLAITDAYI